MAFIHNTARLFLRATKPSLPSLSPLHPSRSHRPPLIFPSNPHIVNMSTKQGTDPPVDLSQPTIFDKIISKEISAKIVYEDDLSLAFHDVNPQAPVHILVIPKRRIPTLSMAQESDKDILGHLMLTAAKVAESEGLQEGYRVLVNNGKNGLQSVYHIHLHVIGGRKLKWGPF